MTKEFYSTTEVANIFKVSRITVFNWIKRGTIEATKIGRNYVVPHKSVVEKLGRALGDEKKAGIEKTINKAIKEYEQTFRKLGKE